MQRGHGEPEFVQSLPSSLAGGLETSGKSGEGDPGGPWVSKQEQ
jgi:hypothetical protein